MLKQTLVIGFAIYAPAPRRSPVRCSGICTTDPRTHSILQGLHASQYHDQDANEFSSETATERRTSCTSRGGESSVGESDVHLDHRNARHTHDNRTSLASSDVSYDTGSYMTGSEIDRRTSLGSSANGVLGVHSVIDEEPNEERPAHDLRDHPGRQAAEERDNCVFHAQRLRARGWPRPPRPVQAPRRRPRRPRPPRR